MRLLQFITFGFLFQALFLFSNSAYSQDTCFIDRLQNNDSYSITISSSGCFQNEKNTFVITRIKDTYFAKMGNKESILNSDDIIALRVFEKEMQKKRSAGCTTVDVYTVTFKKESITMTDGSCTWNGGMKLIKLIFD